MQSTSSPDKIIVDRRRSARNSDMRKTMRKTRDRLAVQSGDDSVFSEDTLRLHAESLATGISALPILILITTVLGLSVGHGFALAIWAIITSAIYALFAVVARRYTKRKGDDDWAKWRRFFIIGHAAAGVAWTAFVLLQCTDCSPFADMYFKTAIFVIAIAATATISYSLVIALPITFVAPIITFIASVYVVGSEHVLTTAIVTLGVLLFFSYLSLRLYRSTLASLSFRNENQTLIAELEMAKSISDEARRRAEESNLAKSRFLASMSHELRTPLNAILGFSETMTEEVFGPIGNPQYKTYAGDIHESGQHLLNLINEILDLSRVEAGKYELREEQLHLCSIAEDCMSLIKLKADQKQIKLVANFNEQMPKMLLDERATRQIILNILSNAVKFTPRGGLVTVKVGWTSAGGQYIAVCDNGSGIPEEEIPIVLSAFGQGSIAIKNAEQGTGLGLPIVQALIAMHGGNFKLNSQLRVGTEAIASFPRSRVLQSMPAEPITEEPKEAGKKKAAAAG